MARQLAEVEVGLDALEHAVGLDRGVALLHGLYLVYVVLAGVAHRHVQQLGLVAALGYGEAHPLHLDVGHLGHDDLVIFDAKLFGYLVHGIAQHLGARLVEALAIFEGHALHHCSAPHVHVVHVDVALILVDAEHVHVLDRLRDDDALGPVARYEVILYLQLLCLLEPQLGRQAFHLGPQVSQQLGRVAAQYGLDALYVGAIFDGGHEPLAGSLAAFQVIVEA